MKTKQLVQPELITIDLDGTLVDSVADLHAAVVTMQQDLGLDEASIESVRSWVGNGIDRLVHRALTNSMHNEATHTEFNNAIDRFRLAYDNTNGCASTLYGGVREGLEWLYTLDIPLVCVTNKAGRYSRPLLESLDIARYFSHHIAGDDIAEKKPNPAALLEAARRCNAMPTRSLMIGDSLSDVKAAHAAQFKMIGVSYGYNHGTPLARLKKEYELHAIIDSFTELPDCLQSLFNVLPD